MSKASPPRILVTRSEPGASETAGRLAALGYQPVVEPLFGIEPMAAVLPPFDALAFTSANGVRVFAGLEPRRDAPVFCVGGRTAEAALAAGFANVISADGDFGALAVLIGGKLVRGARLLHTGNEESRGDLAGELASKGISAAFVPTFRAKPVIEPGTALIAHLGGRAAFEAVLIHSPRGASILAAFISKGRAPAALNVAAISLAAAAPLANLAHRLEIAATPDDAALLDALSRLSLSG
ncbi:MAG: uroporphyrinogen-III synthase [Hyphomonadaceae bacterium]|nr:uroporphyrinogen-III synthase [Hyphomonadaceae bacterium]